ncbi:type VI secretion system Vgr family protein [Paraburkholderia sp.]|uniref:type VI secretion system Vgr family protein n=1 Tax=Paraburkholderia sp. TaxID=1926495 RepID=UPI003C7BA30A
MSQKTGSTHRRYRLDMPQASSAELADIFAFEGERAIGEPTRYQIRFTHPQPDLSRTDYLNKPAAFVIQPPFNPIATLKPEPERRVQGVITGFSQRGGSQDETTYEVVLASRLALLRNVPKCRFFLEKSFPEIIEQILREHGFDKIRGSFEFNLYRQYGRRAFVMQWQEDDLTFITRLCRRSGIWFVCEEGKHCENVRFGDDFTHYRRDPDLTVPYRQYSGLESSGAESVDSLEMDAATLPTSYRVRTFSTERPVSEPIEAASRIKEDRTTYGEAYTWGTPDLSEDEAKTEALLRHEAAVAGQVVYRGTCNMLDLAPSCILKFSNRKLPDAECGLVTVRVKCSASRKQPYRVEFTAIPSDRQYRLPLLEHMWPRIEGVITGTIASPGGYKDPYLDAQGSYIVRIHADPDKRKPGLESCPMRLAKPFAGAGQTGFHFGLVEGTIVTVGFLWGCPDLPFISQVLHTAQDTDPINSAYPWATRNTLRTRSNNTFQLEDRAGREHIKVATEQGKSQLNLGHTVDRDQNERGIGAELRTDKTAVMRGGAGAMMTAYSRPGGRGHQIDMQETVAQLKEMLALAESLAQSAAASKASPADTSAQKAINAALSELRQPGALVTAPGPVGIVSGDGVQLAADGSIIATAKKGMHFSALKRFTVAARDLVSVFTQKGMSLIAAAGAVVVQAQRGRMQLASQEDMTIETVGGVLHVKSPKEIVLNVGGSYFRMTPDGIEMGTRGGILFRTNRLKKTGPAQMDLGGAAFAPKFVPFTTDCEVWRTNPKFTESTACASVPGPAQREESGNAGAVPLLAPSPGTASLINNRSDAAPLISARAGNAQIPSPPLQMRASPAGNGGLVLNDSANAPDDTVLPPDSDGRDGDNYVTDPLLLSNPAPCNWTMPNFEDTYAHRMEIASYYPWTDEQTHYAPGGNWRLSSGNGGITKFKVSFDGRFKTLTASVKVGVILMDIVEVDPATEAYVRLSNGLVKSVPYDSFGNGDNAPRGSVPDNLKFIHRDTSTYDFASKAQMIRNTLNKNSYKLILDGCSKAGACGCRISIKFDVEFVVVESRLEPHALECGKVIRLFPYAFRDDSANWGEVVAELKRTTNEYKKYDEDYTAAHECGHLFNYPDEYFQEGGAVHEQYVANQQLQFSKGHQLAGTPTWQLISENNLMGNGARKKISGGAAPDIPPYYMEYLRRWMTKHTKKKWRIGANVACWQNDENLL